MLYGTSVGKRGKIIMRKALYILGQLTDLDIDWLIDVGQRQTVSGGTTLIQQGQSISSVYLTLDGLFSVVDETQGGEEVARLGSGEILGEMSFIDTNPPVASVRALRESHILAIPRLVLQQKLEQDTAFAARFYRALAIFLSDRLRATMRRLGYGSPEDHIEEGILQEDELDPSVLGQVHQAGNRFEHILKRLAQAR